MGRDPFLKKGVLTSLAGKIPKKMQAILLGMDVFQFSHVLGAAGVFPVFFLPRFWLLVSFFPWIGGRFCSAEDWVVFLTFLELLVHFPFTFLEVSCVFTMAMKSHSRFWLSH